MAPSRVTRTIRALRRLTPPNGQAYELFDSSVLLLILGAVGYVYTSPSPVARDALAVPFSVDSQSSTWGILLSAAAIIGILCSYQPRALRVGYVTVIMVCAFWSICFLLGLVFYDASIRSLVSAVIYAWIARRLMREVHQ